MLNLVVHAGAARLPDGDAVQFDLRTGSANPVSRQLRDRRLDQRGLVIAETVDAAITDADGAVFISVTTIPAAAALGLSLACQDEARAQGSFLQLLLNVVLLILAGTLALRIQRLIWRADGRSSSLLTWRRNTL